MAWAVSHGGLQAASATRSIPGHTPTHPPSTDARLRAGPLCCVVTTPLARFFECSSGTASRSTWHLAAAKLYGGQCVTHALLAPHTPPPPIPPHAVPCHRDAFKGRAATAGPAGRGQGLPAPPRRRRLPRGHGWVRRSWVGAGLCSQRSSRKQQQQQQHTPWLWAGLVRNAVWSAPILVRAGTRRRFGWHSHAFKS